MNSVLNEDREELRRENEEQKSEQSSDQIYCCSSIVFSKKRMKLMKENMLQSYYVIVPNIRVRKFQIDSQKFGKFASEQVFVRNLMRLKKSEKRIMILILIMIVISSSFLKFKLFIFDNNSSNMFNILNHLILNGE